MHDAEQRAEQLVRTLNEAGVSWVIAALVDSSGITRVKVVPLDRLPQALRSGIGIATAWNAVLSNDAFTAPELSGCPVGDLRLIPDLDSLVQLADTPRWAWVAVDQHLQDGTVSPACPRTFLKRMIARAAEHGFTLQIGYECEWFTAREEAGTLQPIHRGPGYSATALVDVQELADAILMALAAQDMPIEQFHPEYGIGQLEVSLAPGDPLSTADHAVLFRHTVRAVTARHGWRASFSPVTIPGLVGNGCHVHFSLRDAAGHNLFSGGDRILELTATGEAFLAGVYAHLPAIVAITCPTVLSYHRLQPRLWAGAYQCWGHENREAALRFIQGMAGARHHTANMELKCADAAGHPYLVPGVIIAAGLDGVQRGLRLPPPIAVDPAGLSEEELAARGIRRLPATLDEAAEALAASPVLRAAMGEYLHDCTVAVRRAEAASGRDETLERLVATHLWRC